MRILLGFLSYLEELKRQTQILVGTSLRLNPNCSSICLTAAASSINSEAPRIANGSLVHLLSNFSFIIRIIIIYTVQLSLAMDWRFLCQLYGATPVRTAARKMKTALYIPSHHLGHEMSPLFRNHKWQFSGTAATHDPSMVVPLLKTSPGCFRLPAVPSFLLARSSAVSLCQSGLNMSLSVISRGPWQLSISLAFVFRSALLTVPFAIVASVNYVRLLGGIDQTTQWQYQCGRAIMDPHSAVCLSVYHHLPAH